MINLDANFIAENELDITWDSDPKECIVEYYFKLPRYKMISPSVFRSKQIGDEPSINTLLRALREAYDFINKNKENE